MRIITVIAIFILSLCFILGFSFIGLSNPSNSSVSIIDKINPSESKAESLGIQDYNFGYCLSAPPLYKESGEDYEVVIDDLETLKTLINNSPKCKDSKISLDFYLVDFTKWTLIGKQFTIVGGCGVGTTFMVTVTQDKQQHIYNHTIVVGSESAKCAGNSRHQSWILVPKLPLAYHVEFNNLVRYDSIIYCGNKIEY